MGKNIRYAVSGLFALAMFLFFAFRYSYHIYFQEQFQLFEFTWRYFLETFLVPGGLAEYVARFFTQFYYYAVIGAAILALLLGFLQQVAYRVSHNFPLSFLPAALMLIFMLDGEAMLSSLVALVAALVLCIPSGKLFSSGGFVCLVSVILCFLLGPLAVVYPLIKFSEVKKWWLWAPVTAIFLFLEIWISHRILHYPYFRLLYGTGYYRFIEGMPLWPWLAALASVAVFYIGRKVAFKKYAEWGVCTGLLAATVAGVWLSADFKREEAMEYDFLVRRCQWDAIIAKANRKSPDTPNNVTCLNLALAMKGQLKHQMFNYFQCGTEGLMPSFSPDYVSSFPVSEVYYYIGMINTARRFTFATQENNPNGQRSARCYKRLAETNMINGLYDASRLYLKPLLNTLFYRQWAKQMMSMLGDEKAMDANPVYGFLRRSRLHNSDFMFNRSTTDSMMAYLINENPQNSLAIEYLYAWLLLDKNLDELKMVFNIQSDKDIPANYWQYYRNYRKEGEK